MYWNINITDYFFANMLNLVYKMILVTRNEMTFKPLFSLLSSAILGLTLYSSCASAHSTHHHDSDSQVIVKNAHVRAFLPASQSTVGYLSLVNHGEKSVLLTKASIESLGRVEIHEHTHVDGVMRMQQVDSLELKAHEQIDFKPGGYHLMAFEPTTALKVGQELKLTLYFNDGNRVFTQAEVVSLESQVEQTSQSENNRKHH
jgi:hypothetical protein